MTDTVLVALIAAIGTISAALIGAFVTMSGKGRETAILDALRARDDENRRLLDENLQLRATTTVEPSEDTDDPTPRRRRHAPKPD